MHTALAACLLYAPGAVYFLDMVLEHIWLRIFFKTNNGTGPYGPGAYFIQDHTVLGHKSRPKSQQNKKTKQNKNKNKNKNKTKQKKIMLTVQTFISVEYHLPVSFPCYNIRIQETHCQDLQLLLWSRLYWCVKYLATVNIQSRCCLFTSPVLFVCFLFVLFIVVLLLFCFVFVSFCFVSFLCFLFVCLFCFLFCFVFCFVCLFVCLFVCFFLVVVFDKLHFRKFDFPPPLGSIYSIPIVLIVTQYFSKPRKWTQIWVFLSVHLEIQNCHALCVDQCVRYILLLTLKWPRYFYSCWCPWNPLRKPLFHRNLGMKFAPYMYALL